MTDAARTRSLLERVTGPNARPVDQLVKQADAGAQKVARQYQGFARARVQDIAGRLKAIAPDSPDGQWQALLDMVQDLRSSSATCGEEAIHRVAISWERALDPQYRSESKLMAVMQLHLDALRLAVSQNADQAELRALANRLETLVISLAPAAPPDSNGR